MTLVSFVSKEWGRFVRFMNDTALAPKGMFVLVIRIRNLFCLLIVLKNGPEFTHQSTLSLF